MVGSTHGSADSSVEGGYRKIRQKGRTGLVRGWYGGSRTHAVRTPYARRTHAVRTPYARRTHVRGWYGGWYGDFVDFVRISYGFRTKKIFFEEKDAEFQGNVESIEKFRYLQKKNPDVVRIFLGCVRDFVRTSYGRRTDVRGISYGRTGDLVRTYGGSRTDFVRTSYGFLAVLTDTPPLVFCPYLMRIEAGLLLTYAKVTGGGLRFWWS